MQTRMRTSALQNACAERRGQIRADGGCRSGWTWRTAHIAPGVDRRAAVVCYVRQVGRRIKVGWQRQAEHGQGESNWRVRLVVGYVQVRIENDTSIRSSGMTLVMLANRAHSPPYPTPLPDAPAKTCAEMPPDAGRATGPTSFPSGAQREYLLHAHLRCLSVEHEV